MGRAVLAVLLIVCGLLVSSAPAQAHRDGCHAWHSCPSDTGSYVCGDTGHFSQCGYSSLPADPVAPPAPVLPEVDRVAPRRPVVTAPSYRPRGVVALSATAESGASLVIRSGGRVLLRATATGAAQALSFQALDGRHKYAVAATDSSGNTSRVTSFVATADAVAPSLQDAVVQAGTAGDSRTRVSFAAGESANYLVKVDGRRLRSGHTDGSETDVTFPLANGRHQVLIQLTDEAGNVGTLRRRLKVAVDALAPTVKHVITPGEGTQQFIISGSPGSSGTLTLGGAAHPVRLGETSTELNLDLPDGEYPAGTLTLRDEVGRTGTVDVPTFVIDTTSPLLEVRRRDDDSTVGRLVALIATEEGARVDWRVLGQAGEVVQRESYLADGHETEVDVDVAEGTSTIVVQAADEAGNVAPGGFEADIAADPLTATDWLLRILLLGALLGCALLGWRWRGRIRGWVRARRHAQQVRAARQVHEVALREHEARMRHHSSAMADHRSRVNDWDARQQHLTSLLDEVRSSRGTEPVEFELLGAKLKPTERVYAVLTGALVEQRTRRNVPTIVEVERGQIALTDHRVLFQGRGKKREWAFDKFERSTEPSIDTTMLRVTNRKSLSGVRLDDPERGRVLLALALGAEKGERPRIAERVERLITAHGQTRPGAPPAKPVAPVAPAILHPEAPAPDRAGARV